MGFFSDFLDDLIDPNRRERKIAEQNLQQQLTQQRGVLTSNLAASGLSGPTRQFGIEKTLGDISQQGSAQIQSQFPKSNFLPQLLFTLAGAALGGPLGASIGLGLGQGGLKGGLAGAVGGGGFGGLFGGGGAGKGVNVGTLEGLAQRGEVQSFGSPLGSIQGFDFEAFRNRFSQTGVPNSGFSLTPLGF